MTAVTISNVKLNLVATAPFGELAEHVLRTCSFCAKEVETYPAMGRINERLAGGKEFYCSFCLRNNFHTKNSRHVLVMSFRGILGYYYYGFYQRDNRKMWLTEIEDYAHVHERVGLVNPVFYYDPSTMLWFLDFLKIGTSRKKIKIEEVLKTVVNILATFNLSQNIPYLLCDKLFQKYKEVILNFYSQRYRPDSRRMLIPTLLGCSNGSNVTNAILEKSRNFTLEVIDMDH